MKYKPLLAEFIATFALTYIGMLAIHASQGNLVGIALAHGLTIAVFAAATGAVSGGHINPAVTIAFMATKRMCLRLGTAYIIAQCAGAVFAAMTASFTLGTTALQSIGYGMPALGSGVSPTVAVVVEILLTFFLMFVIMGTAVDSRAPKMGGLFIGLAVSMDILAGGPITGAAMNPARWFGPALIGGGFANAWVYIVGPIVGAVLAALVGNAILIAPEES